MVAGGGDTGREIGEGGRNMGLCLAGSSVICGAQSMVSDTPIDELTI